MASLFLYAMQYLGDDAYVQVKSELHKCLDVYYADCPDCDKSRVLASFCEVNGCVRVVIASVAFGLGINVTNVRKIVIWGLPETFLTLWQEIGRGGRDGEKAQAFLFYNKIPTALRDVFTCKNCLRYGILKNLTLPFYDSSCLGKIGGKKLCNKKCDLCQCTSCNCCSICESRCPCK